MVFRQHSCSFGEMPESRWRGLFSVSQRDISGGVRGWNISIRVYVFAMIPASHPEMYQRGLMRVDVSFPFPPAFHVLLGREIRMRGELHWEGTRASRGQSMSLMWVPFPGDREGLTGPIHIRRWVFESDFRYSDRPDVMVSMLSLQLCDVAARGTEEEETETQSPLPRAAREQRRRRNDKCEWWERKSTGRYQRLSDDENEEEGPSFEQVGQRGREAMEHMENARFLSLTRPSSSSADVSSLPVAEDLFSPVAASPADSSADDNDAEEEEEVAEE